MTADPTAAYRALLLADVAVAALVDERIYLQQLPQDPTLPAIRFRRVSQARGHQVPTRFPVYQTDCCAATHIEAEQLADAVVAATQRAKTVQDGVHITQGVIVNEIDLYDVELDMHVTPVDVRLHIIERS
ncbi:MAG: DUF3168 domain-containing protein [bacterium]